MTLLSLTAENYRNIREANLTFSPGVNLLFGENAQGKTNALEGIYLFARGKSYRGATDDALVRFGEKGFKLGITYRADGREQTLAYRYWEGSRQRQKNGANVRISEMIGSFRAVLFCPEHLSLIKGSPSERRAFLNIAIAQNHPVYLKLCDEYNRILENRNCLLKNLQKGLFVEREELESWTERFMESAAEILLYRREYVRRLSPLANDLLRDLSSGRETMTLAYESEAEGDGKEELVASYRRLFRDLSSREAAAGCSLFGVHRDDLDVKINGISARSFASQGQQRSAVLALKLAEGEVCREMSGEYPVFLFDDVMSELDGRRREYVLRETGDRQMILTSCETEDFDPRRVHLIRVSGGSFEKQARERETS